MMIPMPGASQGCWKKGCGCVQTRHPKMTIVFYTCAALMLGGLLWDSGRLYVRCRVFVFLLPCARVESALALSAVRK